MTWSNAPAMVSQLRTQLAACASAATAGLTSGRFHYPSALLTDDNGVSADTRPLCVLAEERAEVQTYAAGAGGLRGGTLTATIFAELTAGQMEDLAQDLLAELLAQQSGLLIQSASVGLCSDPQPGARAADDSDADPPAEFRSISITITHGLNP